MGKITIYKAGEQREAAPADLPEWEKLGWALEPAPFALPLEAEVLFIVQFIVGLETWLPVMKRLEELKVPYGVFLYKSRVEREWVEAQTLSMLKGKAWVKGSEVELSQVLTQLELKVAILTMPPTPMGALITLLREVAPECYLATCFVGTILSGSSFKGSMGVRGLCDAVYLQSQQSFDRISPYCEPGVLKVTGLPRFDGLLGLKK